MKLSNLINVIDVESTGSNDNSHSYSEIIEIGISVVDTHYMKVISTESILVKPQRSTVNEFITNLTTLTQEQVDSGIYLDQAIDLLKNKYKAKDRLFVSFGDFDKNIFIKNCKDYKIKYPFGRHLNVKNLLAVLNHMPQELEMTAALQFCNLSLVGVHHRGDSDSFNIAQILIQVMKTYQFGKDFMSGVS